MGNQSHVNIQLGADFPHLLSYAAMQSVRMEDKRGTGDMAMTVQWAAKDNLKAEEIENGNYIYRKIKSEGTIKQL